MNLIKISAVNISILFLVTFQCKANNNCANGTVLEILGDFKWGITSYFSLGSSIVTESATYSWEIIEGTSISINGSNNEMDCSFKAGCSEGNSKVKLTLTDNGETCEVETIINIKKPTGENPSWLTWGASPYFTIGAWSGTLTPVDVIFTGIKIIEKPGNALDTCWCNGSLIPHAMLSGGTWTIGSGNVWSNDGVGWTTGAVAYYRLLKQTPCGFSLEQKMEVVCPNGENFQYESHQIKANITETTVSSSKDGAPTKIKIWP